MPKLLEITQVKFELDDLTQRTPIIREPEPRSKGIHVSGVIKHCAVAAKILKPGEPLEEELPMRMALGIAWEEFLASLYPETGWWPGEFWDEGVYMNPDGTYLLPNISRELVVEEVKLTWKKPRSADEILNEKIWCWQMMSYCRVLESRLCRLHAGYVNGSNWKGPEYWRYLIQFSDKEIDQNWQMIQNNKDGAEKEK